MGREWLQGHLNRHTPQLRKFAPQRSPHLWPPSAILPSTRIDFGSVAMGAAALTRSQESDVMCLALWAPQTRLSFFDLTKLENCCPNRARSSNFENLSSSAYKKAQEDVNML